jgi:heme oxygenase (biliverdin-producing, ferredoxin)
MLERSDIAGHPLRPASLLEALRERTRDLHMQAERSGIIADILQGRATRHGYVLLVRNLLPVYQALEEKLTEYAASPLVGPLARPELVRAAAIEADLRSLSGDATATPMLPAAANYVNAIARASRGDGGRLIAHAYARYLGDLSGGQIVKRLLQRSLNLSPASLSFYDFPAIADIAAFKSDYRAAIDRAGDESEDFDAIVEESALAFELNIELSVEVQAASARDRRL